MTLFSYGWARGHEDWITWWLSWYEILHRVRNQSDNVKRKKEKKEKRTWIAERTYSKWIDGDKCRALTVCCETRWSFPFTWNLNGDSRRQIEGQPDWSHHCATNNYDQNPKPRFCYKFKQGGCSVISSHWCKALFLVLTIVGGIHKMLIIKKTLHVA